MKKLPIFIIVICVLAAGVVFWYVRGGSQTNSVEVGANSGTSTNTPAVAEITVAKPVPNTIISSPVTISGNARAFESRIVVRIKDSSGAKLFESGVQVNAPDAGRFGPYSVSAKFKAPKTAIGVIEAFEYSPKDGSEIHKTIVPIRFKK